MLRRLSRVREFACQRWTALAVPQLRESLAIVT